MFTVKCQKQNNLILEIKDIYPPQHFIICETYRAPLITQLVKNPPAMQETPVPFLGWEDPMEKGKATHSSIPAWKLPWMEMTGRLQSMGSQRVGYD